MSALAGVVIRADVCNRMHVAMGEVVSGVGRVDCARVIFAMGSDRLTFAVVGVSSSRALLLMYA